MCSVLISYNFAVTVHETFKYIFKLIEEDEEIKKKLKFERYCFWLSFSFQAECIHLLIQLKKIIKFVICFPIYYIFFPLLLTQLFIIALLDSLRNFYNKIKKHYFTYESF